MSGPRTVTALAPAKINLWLEVLGRRADGYHEIKTWMLAIDLCDRIEARARDGAGVGLELGGEAGAADVPSGRANLAWRGAEEVIRAGVGEGLLQAGEAGVDLFLEKRIPSQAGLGGGSSDAAAAWVATAALLGIEPGPGAARSRLGALGSDCVFFVEAARTGAGRCEGRGERVQAEPAPERAWWIAVLSPDLACPTGPVYAALRRSFRPGGSAPELPERWFEMPASEVRPLVFNRLEEAALEAVPRLRTWRKTLDAAQKGAWHLSGSGSSFFALFDERDGAEAGLDEARIAARAAGFPVRGGWICRPAGHGAKKLDPA